MNFSKCFVLFVVILTAGAIAVGAMETEHKVVTSDTLQWAESKGLPGAKFAVLTGDPSKEGLFNMRLLLPAGLKVLPHWHPSDEHVTVLSGSMRMGMGDQFDPNTGKTIPAGGYSFMAAKVHHYAWFTEETIIQITGMGPWKIVYVNPADDPANQKK